MSNLDYRGHIRLPWRCLEHPDAQIKRTWLRTAWPGYMDGVGLTYIDQTDHDEKFECNDCGRELAKDND